ncbi:MAG: hypothetical protein GXC76_09450 [Rhodanobacteraceae bacterium]|jgi:hypothetical protein|nr:hypothetical protein [Rhodanobacteraceae bacterium]
MDSVAGVRRWGAPRISFHIVLIGLIASCVAACEQRASDKAVADKRRPQQAGQPIDPYATAGHIMGARVAVLTGDTRAAEAHVNAMARDITRSARMPDAHRPIDREAARAAVRPLPGVRSAVWLDAANLIVMVDGQRHRSMDMIDQVCLALEPLGDTLAVVVNVQDATAKNGDEAMTLSRNCQLPEDERAFMQAKRQVDVVAPEVREQFKKMQGRQGAYK